MLYRYSSTVSLSFRETPTPAIRDRPSLMGEGLPNTTPPKPLVLREPTPALREPLVWWRQRNIQPEGTLLTRPPPLDPRPKKGAGLSEVRGTTRQQRFGEGTQVSWRNGWLPGGAGLPGGGSRGLAGCTEEAAPGRSHDPGKTVWAPSPVSGPAVGHRGVVFEPVSSPRKLQGRSALRSRPPGQHPLVGGV